jgi:hypothetical protein
MTSAFRVPDQRTRPSTDNFDLLLIVASHHAILYRGSLKYYIATMAFTTTPLPPSKDPWYTASDGLGNAAPGAVLRIRPAPGNLVTNVGTCSAAYNILYRTVDSRQKTAWAVTTLFVPSKPSIDRNAAAVFGKALLSYQVPYDSCCVDASPSASLYSPQALGLDQIKAALARGWHVSVPDYEGPLASFTLGLQAGQATLDSIRAILSLAKNTDGINYDISLSSKARYAMWGYSGGSIATEWAAELQQSYAPELHFGGIAIGGMITNVWSVLTSVTGKTLAGLIPSGLLGMTTQYPEARAHLIANLKAEGAQTRDGFLAALDMDMDTAMRSYAFHDMFAYFVNGKADLEHTLIQEIIENEGIMGTHGVPKMPIFAYASIQDELTPIGGADALFEKYANKGARIVFHRNLLGSHLAEFENGRERAMRWLNGALGGEAEMPAVGLTVEEVSVLDGERVMI